MGLFTFYPRPVLAFGHCRCLRLSVCVCVRPCVNHELVRAITHHPLKLGSPNLNHQCKIPWLRSLLFFFFCFFFFFFFLGGGGGGCDYPWSWRSNSTSNKNLSHFEPVRAITHHPFKLGLPNLDQRCLNTLVKIPVVLGIDWAWHVQFYLFSKSCLFASLLRLWNICETCKKRMKRSLFHILNGYAHICSHTETCHGPWNSRVVSLVWPLLASQSSTGRLVMDFCMLL